jgi:hypothetical protein
VRKILVGLVGLTLVVAGALAGTLRVEWQPSSSGGYSAMVWLPTGDTRAQARLVRAECATVTGASAASHISRSSSARSHGELVFSIYMRWGPDDVRSNPLLDCLNRNRDIDHYVIPL